MKQNRDTKVKKKYVAPKLTKFGSVRQFTQSVTMGGPGDPSPAPTNKMQCIAPAPALEEHRLLLGDVNCQEEFRQAILETVRPGDVVLDLGTGSGLHALFACQAGARKVYAIDSEPVLEIAKEVAIENGYGGHIEFIYGLSQEICLPEKVDVIITNIGFLNTLESLPDACRRFLKPEGRLIPSEVGLSFVPVKSRKYDETSVRAWETSKFGLNFSAFKKYAANHPVAGHFDVEDFLCEPQAVKSFDLSGGEVATVNQWALNFEIEKAGSVAALLCFYTFKLSAHHFISTRPPLNLEPGIWRQALLPFESHLEVKPEQRLKCEVNMYMAGSAYGPLWKWTAQTDEKAVVQTSFDSIPLSRELLKKLQ